MLPRITKISRLRRHPTDQTLSIAQVFGCEHRVVVVNKTATAVGARAASTSSTQWYLGQKVVFLPADVCLAESVAASLNIKNHCRPSEEETTPRFSNRGRIVKVVAVDYNGVVSHGAIVAFEHAARVVGVQSSARTSSVDFVDDSVLFALRPPSSAAMQKLKARTEPLVDLLHNPSLLNALLETPVWISELVHGQRVAIQYDACNDAVRCWDESRVLAPHGWWTFGDRDGAKEMSAAPLLAQFSEALKRIGRQRYGKAVDLYLRGVISTRTVKNDGIGAAAAAPAVSSTGVGAKEEDEKIYFYECALHGARSFVLGAEQFLRMCESSRFPRMPTLYTNRTLRSVINERLGRRRVLLAPSDISFIAPSAPIATASLRYPHRSFSQHRNYNNRGATEERSEESDDVKVQKHTYDYYAKSAPSTNLLSSTSLSLSTSPTASLSLSGGGFGRRNNRKAEGGGVGTGAAEKSGSWRRTTPIQEETQEENEFDSEWFGGISKDRVDWAQCLLLIANQLHERVPTTVGLAIQVYSGSDLLRIVEKFKYMRSRVGAQIVCEQSLLEINNVY